MSPVLGESQLKDEVTGLVLKLRPKIEKKLEIKLKSVEVVDFEIERNYSELIFLVNVSVHRIYLFVY